MKLTFTRYAKERMILRGITKEQIRRCIERGATIKQTDGLLSSYTYLEVAWKQTGHNTYLIKTVKIK